MSRDSDVVTTREELLASRGGAWMQLNTHNALHSPDSNVQISIVRMLQNPAFTNEMKTFDFAKSCTALGHALEHTAMTSECVHLPHHDVHAPAHISANVTTSITAWLGQHSRQRPTLLHIDVGKWTNNSFKLTQMDPNWLLKGLSPS